MQYTTRLDLQPFTLGSKLQLFDCHLFICEYPNYVNSSIKLQLNRPLCTIEEASNETVSLLARGRTNSFPDLRVVVLDFRFLSQLWSPVHSLCPTKMNNLLIGPSLVRLNQDCPSRSARSAFSVLHSPQDNGHVQSISCLDPPIWGNPLTGRFKEANELAR